MSDYPNHDWRVIFTGTTDEIEKAAAEIEDFQPYSDRQLWEAGNYIKCPNCGQLADHDVFQVGEEKHTGRAEYEWHYQCWNCGWSSKSFEWDGDE